MYSRNIKMAVLAGGAVLIVLLMFANTTPPAKKAEVLPAQHEAGADHFSTHVSAAAATLGAAHKERAALLEEQAKAGGKQGRAALDSLVKLWDDQRRPDIAAYYTEKAAETENSKNAWKRAGERYYYSVGFVSPDERSELYSNAIRCFNKALEIAPGDLDVKTSLAACYVEGTAQPMDGIRMLQEVVEKDPNNVNAHIQLGVFSMKSGQFDKAVMRFQKVTELDPQNIEIYLYLADAFVNSGNKQAAIKNLEKYRDLTDDITVKTEIQESINKLKNTN